MSRLSDAIANFRAVLEATTAPSLGQGIGAPTGAVLSSAFPTHTDKGSIFFGIRGLKQIDRERRRRLKLGWKADERATLPTLPILRRAALP